MRKVPTNNAAPLVSVVVATYNRPERLRDCLRSIRSQTYPNIEIVVVNDAGIEVREIIEPLNGKGNITYIAHPFNRGVAAARNTGIGAANGKYLAYLDDDDIFYPEHVETLVSVLEGSDYRVAYSDANRGHHTTDGDRSSVTKRDVPYSYEFDSDHILIRNFIPTPCILHDKSILDDVGNFDESLPVLEDWDLWIRLSRKYPFRHIRKVTCEFSWETGGDTLTVNKRALFRKTVEVIYEKTFELVRDDPHALRSRRNYLRGMKFLSFLSDLLGEQSDSFRWIQNALTAAYNRRNRFRR